MNNSLQHTIPPGLPSDYDLYIFDLDGTLYDQQYIRNIMLRVLFMRLLTFRISLNVIQIINTYRKLRENNLGYTSPDIENAQYEWVAKALDIPAPKVKQVIEYWMLVYPLQHLLKARYPGVEAFFRMLRQHRKHIVIYSDFPVEKKLAALELEADKTFCSTESTISQLKPSRKGVEMICEDLGCTPRRTVYFGDREDTDGESARMAGVEFIRIDPAQARRGKFYPVLSTLFKDKDHE